MSGVNRRHDIMKEKPFQLTVALVLSAALHIMFISHLSGIEWLELARPDSDRIIDLDLSSDTPLPEKAARSSTGTPAKVRKEEEPSPATAGTHTITEATLQDHKANDGKPEISADNPLMATGAEELKPPVVRTAEVPAEADSGQKPEVKGPLLMTGPSERFSYDISWSGIHVGQAMLAASDENGVIRITSQVHSASVISLFYKVEDSSESTVVNGLPSRFRIKQHEGKYRSDKDTVFDAEDKEITFYNYLSNKMEEHSIMGGLPWDVLSGFYYLRTLPLAEGQTVYIDIFDSGKFLKVAVNVVRKERLELRGVGELDTVMVRLLLKSEGLFKSQGDVSIWLTDDEKRIPVRVETKVPIGKVTAELSSMKTDSEPLLSFDGGR